jgi:hypothetical protein
MRYNKVRTNPWEQESEVYSMTTETITLRVDARAAQAFNTASEAERRTLEALVSLRLLEVAQTTRAIALEIYETRTFCILCDLMTFSRY